MQSTFPGSTIGAVDGSVLGDLIARDVTIMGRDKRPLATVKTLTLEAALFPLVGKTARVKSITAEDVVVYARDQAQPRRNQPRRHEPSTWSVELPAIHVVRGRVVIETATRTEVVDNLSARMSLLLRAGEPLQASVNAHATFRGENVDITAVATQGEVLEVPYAMVSLGGARVFATHARIDGARIAGNLLAYAPAALTQKLAEIELPGDAWLRGNHVADRPARARRACRCSDGARDREDRPRETIRARDRHGRGSRCCRDQPGCRRRCRCRGRDAGSRCAARRRYRQHRR